jgi:hypothetical protein
MTGAKTIPPTGYPPPPFTPRDPEDDDAAFQA